MTIQTVAPGQKYLSSKNYEINFKDFDREFSLTIIRVDSLWQRSTYYVKEENLKKPPYSQI
jgi:hypothetical protein